MTNKYKLKIISILLAVISISACAPKDFTETTEVPQKKATPIEESQEVTQPERVAAPGFVSVDVLEKRIEIPQNHMESIYKDTYAEQIKIYDTDIIDEICNDINSSGIILLDVGTKRLIATGGF